MRRFTMTGKLLRWGNSYGIRIAKADAERAGLHVGDEFEFGVAPTGGVDISSLPSFDWGGGGAKDHDAILGQGRSKDLERSRR